MNIHDKTGTPIAVILGSPREVCNLIGTRSAESFVCYQMDEYPAGRLREELDRAGLVAEVRTGPDLWDMGADFPTALYPAPRGGEASLKRDMVEQAFHILRPGGVLVVQSPYAPDRFFPEVIKKVFGKLRSSPTAGGTL